MFENNPLKDIYYWLKNLEIILNSHNTVSHHRSHIRYPVLYHRNENKDVSEIRLVSLWGSLLE